MRYQKDIAIAAKASNDDLLRRTTQRNINKLQANYEKISEKAGLIPDKSRMAVAGFRKVKTADELKKRTESSIIITDKQLGKKAGKHVQEWGLNPSLATDREKFISLSESIKNNATEVRRVPWKVDKTTGKRTVDVYAYIRGNDVVLTDDNNVYITTLKDGITNKRVQGGKIIKNGR